MINTKLRVCVCVSGQLRGDLSALDQLRKQLVGCELTFVVSVWNRFASKHRNPLTYVQLKRLLGDDAAGAVPRHWYSEVIYDHIGGLRSFVHSDDHKLVDPEALRGLLGPDTHIDVIEEDSPILDFGLDGHQNALRMTYKIWRANLLKLRLEQERGSRFDVVIRTRPDIVLDALSVETLHPYVDDVVGVTTNDIEHVDDVFFCGSSAVMDRVSALFGRLIVAGHRDWRDIHYAYGDYFRTESLTVRPIAGRVSFREAPPFGLSRLIEGLQEPLETCMDPAERVDRTLALYAAQAVGGYAAPTLLATRAADERLNDRHDNFFVALSDLFSRHEDPVSAALCAAAATGGLVYNPMREEDHRLRRRLVAALAESGLNLDDPRFESFDGAAPPLVRLLQGYRRVAGPFRPAAIIFLSGDAGPSGAYERLESLHWRGENRSLQAVAAETGQLLEPFPSFWLLLAHGALAVGDTAAARQAVSRMLTLAPDNLRADQLARGL